MLKFMLLIIVTLSIVSLSAITITVRQDGLGNYLTIQAAINASNNGDLVLVHPGRYLENIDFNGKNITVASLKFTTNDPVYIGTTIIDGQRMGSCVRVMGGETSARIIGFSITNGAGFYYYYCIQGGGILVGEYSSLSIESCRIFANETESGGGLYARRANVVLKDTVLVDNLATIGGGGICLEGSEVSFSMNANERCSIYNNYSGEGTDFLCIDVPLTVPVIVDTFTVINPDRYYANTVVNFIEDMYHFSFDIQHAFLAQVNHDLYVAANGNNHNDGLSSASPLKTIAWALHNIASDSLNPKTVHISPGVYSTSENQQKFPLSGKSFVNIEGASQESVIIDGDERYQLLMIPDQCRKFNTKKMSFRNCFSESHKSAIFGAYSTDISFEDLTVSDCHTESYTAMMFIYIGEYHFKNVQVVNNSSTDGIAGVYMSGVDKATFDNCTFRDNHSDYIDYEQAGALRTDASDNVLIRYCIFQNNTDHIPYGGAAIVTTSLDYAVPTYRIENCLFTHNQSTFSNNLYKGRPIGFSGFGIFNIINCTFADNESPSAAVQICADSVNFWNCIFANDTSHQVYLLHPFEPNPPVNHVAFNHCNVQDGIDGVFNEDWWGTIYWQEGNINELPLFNSGNTEKPYELASGSPCIDAGTNDVPGGLYPYDLNGAPRIHGNGVDMGCYEYGSVDVHDDTTPIADVSNIRIYPNPFRENTKIEFDLPAPDEIVINIFNIRGQQVKTLAAGKMGSGTIQLTWNGLDDNGKSTASGVYFCKVDKPGHSYAKKMIKVK